MQLVLDSEQEQLRSSVRKLLADHAPPEKVRAVMEGDDGWDRPLWNRIAGDLGLAGLVVPEEQGGSGAGQVERCVVLEELGRALAPVPFFASAVLAVDTALALGETDLVRGLASGETIGAVALAGEDGSWGSSAETVRATESGDGWTLDGRASFVLAGDIADVVLVYASAGWFEVTGDFARTTLRTLDPTRRLARLDFSGTPARFLGSVTDVLEKVRRQAAVALAAEQVGGMAHVVESTADYAKVRVQFGRPIGSYQGVKHSCADMYSAYEQAVSLLRYAAWAADEAPDELPLAAATVQAFTGPAYFAAAADGVQLHGGIGYTWEHDAHLYYKRAKTSELLFGTEAELRDRLAGELAR
jgi:alkylation response protein AidB-like acyl-CoA dehydrogenase